MERTIIGLVILLFAIENHSFYLDSKNQSKNTIELDWTNTNVHDSLILEYSIIETNTSYKFNLNPAVNNFTIKNLKPGSTLIIELFAFVNGNVTAVSNQLTTNTNLDAVTNLRNVQSTSTTISGDFDPPNGYYVGIEYLCICTTDENIYFYNDLSLNDSNHLECTDLLPGYNYTIVFSTYNTNQTADSDYFSAQTKLEQTIINPNENPSSEIQLNLRKPDGNYDYLEFKVTLLDTNSKSYYINKNLVTNCNLNSHYTYKIYQNQTNTNIDLRDLCMLSNYNVSAKTVLNGFDTVEYDNQFKTAYGNIDCNTLNLSIVSNQTNKIYWSKPNIYVDNYLITLKDMTDSSLYYYGVVGRSNSLLVYGLSYNTMYSFSIRTNATITTKIKKISVFSEYCSATLKTGPPCPTISGPAALNYAPYVYNVSISIDSRIFGNVENIQSIEVIVGDGIDCGKEGIYPLNKCYRVISFEYNEFNYTDSRSLSFNLSTDTNCTQNAQSCNVRFAIDRNYYVSIGVKSFCGQFFSSPLVILVPSPFPLSLTISLTISVSIGLIVILLTTIMVLTYFDIKKFHYEELESMNIKPEQKEIENNNISSF